MKSSRTCCVALLCSSLVSASLTGCATHTQTGAMLGTMLGSGVGAIVGHQTGDRDKGALLGGLAGGTTGALIGNNKDLEEERDAAYSYAAHTERVRQAEARAMNNADIIYMSQQGVDDRTIIGQIQTRGGAFTMSAQDVVTLQQSGVTPTVIQVMQRASLRY